MAAAVSIAPERAVREALARAAYAQRSVRIAEPGLAGWDWLAATHRGLFVVAPDRFGLAVHGWFFGLCLHEAALYAFENCGHRVRDSDHGRIVRFDIADRTLRNPRVLVEGLHNNCHQLAVIDGLLCLVDTANQAIRRYTLEGEAVDVRRPFPVARPTDRSGAYLHVNSIARIGARIGLVLHNGKALPLKPSEIAWLDADWQVVERYPLPGHQCHDIVADDAGRLWHTLSQEGVAWRSDGRRVALTDDKMTRGIALAGDTIAVGISTFGPRHVRGTLNGSVVLLDRATLARRSEIALPAAPADLIAL